MPDLIIDFSYTKPDPAVVKRSGYVGAICYVSHDPRKNWTRTLIDAYRQQGLQVAIVFEDTANQPLGGFAQGKADGAFANNQADMLGWPPNRPIYYAVDFDVQPGQVETVLEYISGAFAANTKRPAGLYGGLRIIDAPQNTLYRWQTEAWSGQTVSNHACLYQRVSPTKTLAGYTRGSYDEDVVLRPDWGQWNAPTQPVPAPAPIPPAPSPVPPPDTAAQLAALQKKHDALIAGINTLIQEYK